MQENLDAIQKPFYEDFEKVKKFDEDLNNIRTPIYNWTIHYKSKLGQNLKRR